MNFSNLPIEQQVPFLLELDPKDLSAYCTANSQTAEFCTSPWFWDQKAIKDFGLPISIICQQSPYWQYWFLKDLLKESSPAFSSVLFRAGKTQYAKDYLETIEDKYRVIHNAIDSDDIVTLRYLEPIIKEQKTPEETYYADDPYWYWLLRAFTNGSSDAINFLVAMEPEYLTDTIILDELLTPMVQQNQIRGIRLLHPYIEAMVKSYPAILTDETLGLVLRQYIEDNFKSLISPS